MNAAVHSPHPLNDGRWHVVRCERSAAKVTMTVDGKLVATSPHATGSIGNNFPLTIGGKIKCNQVDVTCDYFAGDIDSVLIQAA